ncbi:MAG: Filamentation induced By CAMP protein Fic [Candidatus Gottesmanbacteria bacterium GW2011_GWA2_44_17]|uniref:Filamentation induced By CAMP protein Fic n=1 Tax=Candidatus Gottesmanbacteria bacterium GW2011_GWA2_44_17 TaxID=1618444 RepID=A0A0G1HGZ2_9BACT|nr:MAG: Filamentation induced By CAMP protein Fic [Candidatus Gottesmanbacteria bacterium GW2011_GWA2_44_17]
MAIDGNGRTARAIFYWYLLKNNYWVFQYLSVSRIIKKSKKQYDDSFLFTETDDDDMTYFLFYKLKAIVLSIKDFTEHYKNKIQNEKNIENLSTRLTGFNQRQISLLQYCYMNPSTTIDILTHQSKHRVAYQTARTDILNLVKKGHFSLMRKGLKFIFVPSPGKIKQLFK